MKPLQIVIEGISPEQIQKDIERNLKGWKLLLYPPKGMSYDFINPFFGHTWNGTSEDLRRIITTYGKVNGQQKHMLTIFQWNGEDKFVWCSWTHELYDAKTGIKHLIEPKYADNITNLIKLLL